LRLEDCVVEALDHTNGNMLIVLNTGRLAVLSFRIDGRSVSGLAVHLVDSAHGGHQLKTAANCAASLGRGRLFLGSEDGDSTLIGWSKKTAQARKRSHAQMIAEDAELSLDEEDSDDDADDDLYADEAPVIKQAASQAADSSGPESYSFRVHDNLFSLGPIKDVCLGKYATELSESAVEPQLSLLASVGRERASKLAFINRELTPSPLRTVDIPHAQAVWTACAKQAAPRGSTRPTNGTHDPEAQLASDIQYDQYLITCHADEDGVESSKVFKINNENPDAKQGDESMTYTEVTGTEFEGEGETLDVGILASGTRIVQVRKHEVRSYDAGKSRNRLPHRQSPFPCSHIPHIHTPFNTAPGLSHLEAATSQCASDAQSFMNAHNEDVLYVTMCTIAFPIQISHLPIACRLPLYSFVLNSCTDQRVYRSWSFSDLPSHR
jgi:cleavage and polyadenylation specificity factor subunit 1